MALAGPVDAEGWRAGARACLAAGLAPEAVAWTVAGEASGLFAAPPPPAPAAAGVSVPRAFPELAARVLRHRDPERFALLYALLWRLAGPAREPHLLGAATDPLVARLRAMEKAVRRDAHKMHAFVRFREVADPDGPRFVAWFEPAHHVLEAEADFFVRRFAALRWSILTPRASAHWDGAALAIGPGATRADAPGGDPVEALWRAYYENVFNPARLKPAAMRAEMPKRYWADLPEAASIPRLLAEAPARAAAMVARGATPPAARRQRCSPPPSPDAEDAMPDPATPDLFADPTADPAADLARLRAEVLASDGPLAGPATQAVFGEGPLAPALMLVGEQPGDAEDLAGRPFVGPAGQMLDRALAEAGIDRGAAYLTNAVKHFKFTPRGRRRLHQTPDAGDVAFYRPWLLREVAIVRPRLVVALGGTALRALAGRALPVTRLRGGTAGLAEGGQAFVTVHPSYLLRLPDPAAKAAEYARFVADLGAARAMAGG